MADSSPTEEQKRPCPVCGRWNVPVRPSDGKQALHVDCARCGAYEIETALVQKFDERTWKDPELRELLPYLRCAVRQGHERTESVTLTSSNWRELAQKHRDSTPQERRLKLLGLIATRAGGNEGRRVDLDQESDGLLFDAPPTSDSQTFWTYVEDLEKDGWIDRQFHETDYDAEPKDDGWPSVRIPSACSITPAGKEMWLNAKATTPPHDEKSSERGRPANYPPERYLDALKKRASGGSWGDCADAFYGPYSKAKAKNMPANLKGFITHHPEYWKPLAESDPRVQSLIEQVLGSNKSD